MVLIVDVSMVSGGYIMPDSLAAVLFDLDDTLLDSFEARVWSLQRVFTKSGISQPTAEQSLRDLHGTQLKEALAQLEVSLETIDKLFEQYRLAYWTQEPGRLRLYSGIKPMLKELLGRGVKLGIVTQKARLLEIDGRCVGAIKELEEMGIGDLFPVIVGFEDVSDHKPNPEGINLALSRLAASPGETLVVGDSAADIEAARAAGCWSCHATWGIPSVEYRLANIQADLVAETPEKLLEIEIWPKRAR